MSYSFELRGADKDAVKNSLKAKWDEICQYQPEHEVDRALAEKAAVDAVELLPVEPEMDIFLSCYGSIYIEIRSEQKKLRTFNMSVSVGLTSRG